MKAGAFIAEAGSISDAVAWARETDPVLRTYMYAVAQEIHSERAKQNKG